MEYYLKYAVGEVDFATPIDEVGEIVRPREVIAVDKPAKNVLGTFDLRGEKIPLYNLPAFLDIAGTGPFEVIISRIGDVFIGFKVQRVFGIVAADELLPFPDIVKAKDFLLGVIPDQGTFLQVISFAKLISGPRRQIFKKIK
jgi:chemotaxis signal transduction protein